MPLALGHKWNFETLQTAFLASDAALMECELAATGEPVAVICAANRKPDGTIEFIPFARMFADNPDRDGQRVMASARISRDGHRTLGRLRRRRRSPFEKRQGVV